MSHKQAFVSIKGTKDGLILSLDDSCAYSDLIADLEDKLSTSNKQLNEGPLISVRVRAGHRFLTVDQRKQIKNIIRAKKKLYVEEIESQVISKQEMESRLVEREITPITKMIRSGQVVQIRGDLLLIGDVNPGARVEATGNIYILGNLRGIAHAGCQGREEAVIAASVMKPSQLRIGDKISRSPDYYEETGHEMECAYVDHSLNQIAIDRIQSIYKLRPELMQF